MADEKAPEAAAAAGAGAASSGPAPCPPAPKCPDCPPPGLPGWLATYSDMVTLLLTFFILLLSFAKTEDSKSEAVLGSVRDALGGNVLRPGKTLMPGKSPDDSPSMLDSDEPIRPFPIDFLTAEGLLDKKEVNRASTEELNKMRSNLRDHDLSTSANIYEQPEGIAVHIKDKILFKEGSIEIKNLSVEVFDKMVKLLTSEDWTVFVEGHASVGETSTDGKMDAYALSAARSQAVSKILMKRGVRPDKITSVFYGDTRPDSGEFAGKIPIEANRRVEFLIRKVDLKANGHKVDAR